MLRSPFTILRLLLPLQVFIAHIYAQQDLTKRPTVRLSGATVIGTGSGDVESFLGIPFAQPPIGALRLKPPQLLESYSGTVNATSYGNQCLQQALVLPTNLTPEILQDLVPFVNLFALNPNVPKSEDCLNINVIRPANTSPNAKLPVLVYIYGGGFSMGSNAVEAYNGSNIVQESVKIGQPIIYVAINYRLNAFGFLGGQEVSKAGISNLGLQDQRVAFRWINKYISAFGGDPEKVTIWGESAGAMSVALHMYTNNGNTEGLFRAGIMSSGSLVPTGSITETQVQETYDFVVDQVGCSGSSDTLACLRTVPADDLVAAVNQTPSVVTYEGWGTPWVPRADGSFIQYPPLHLPSQGKFANLPFIIGTEKDQGTLFSLGSLNITTDDEFAGYINQNWFPGATAADLQPILQAYPSDPAAGSPFDTGAANAFTPEYKRISALQGDWFFEAPRRLLLDKYSSTQPIYNFLFARGNYPGLGDGHGLDLVDAFGPGDMTDYFVRFVATLNPNARTGVQWPRYNTKTRPTLQFNDGSVPLNITSDVERLNATGAVTSLSLNFPF